MIKIAHELELMRLACARDAHRPTKPRGRRCKDGHDAERVRRPRRAGARQARFPGRCGRAGGGVLGAAARLGRRRRPSARAPILLIDGGCAVEGYASDISRTFVLGKPTDKMKKVFDIVHRAQAAALKTAKPGVPCEAVDAAARKVIDRRRLRPRLQVLHPPPRPRHGHGRPRVAVPGAGQHAAAGAGT